MAVEHKNYVSKTVNAYIVYDLDVSPKIILRNSTLKNCLFAAFNIGKDDDNSKYLYSGYGITFDGKGEWNFGNASARNIKTFVA